VRLSWKVLLTTLFVAIVPVAVSGISSVLLARRAVAETASDKLAAEARHLAEVAETTILDASADLTQVSSLGLHRLNKDELQAALGIIYREDFRRNAVALIDGKSGELVVPLVYQREVSDEPGLKDHEAFPDEAAQRFADHIPLPDALRTGRAISLPYADPKRGTPLIALAVKVDGPLVQGGARPWVVAVELSLRQLNKRFEEAGDEGLVAFFVDHDGKTVCHTDPKKAFTRANLKDHEAVQKLFDSAAPSSGTMPPEREAAVLSAWARADRFGVGARRWGVVVERPRKEALAVVEGVSSRALFWVITALLLALAAGIVLSRAIASPLEKLTRVVQKFGAGDEEARAGVRGRDEIGTLGQAFDQMADGIVERDDELRRFNDELQVRVDERTQELKSAQDQLINSQKMAAVGELGAGVAHEINNPLAAVLGSAQLALLRTPEDNAARPALVDIEKEALRIRDIVDSLLKLSSERQGAVFGTVDINRVVEQALAIYARTLIAQRIQVRKEMDEKVPRIRGNSGDLQQVILEVLKNAKEAMLEGGVLTVKTTSIDGKITKLVITDDGGGIAEDNLERITEPFFTTRSGDGHKGMGLAIAHRICGEHDARLHIESRLGQGTEVSVTFPATREKLHLA
jgi:signal transduction histidine kinase